MLSVLFTTIMCFLIKLNVVIYTLFFLCSLNKYTVSLPLRRHTLLHNSVLGAFLTSLSGSIPTRWAQLSAQLRIHNCFNFPHNAERFGGAWRLWLRSELKVHSGWEVAIVASLVLHLNFIALTWRIQTDFKKEIIYLFLPEAIKFPKRCVNTSFSIIAYKYIYTFMSIKY